jgi:hypothetical protein
MPREPTWLLGDIASNPPVRMLAFSHGNMTVVYSGESTECVGL